MSAPSVGAAAPASIPPDPPGITAPRWPLLQSLEGKVVLVDFWASWCSPCLQSFPWMNELQQKHAGEGLVNLDQDRALADAFLKKVPAKFRVEYDQPGNIARQFEVQAMPTSFLIDRRGQVRVRHRGFKDKQRAEREQQIEQLLKEAAP
jgi:cytochrome c biogenesis protein CcmG, thiol:disulfide interchange protein DsbE